MPESINVVLPDEVVMSKIYVIRFPSDFMFELTSEELKNWRCNFGASNRDKMGLKVPPFAFTEHGVLMLASVLNSERAVLVNIQIVGIFIRLREMLQANKDILHKLKEFEKGLSDHDDKIRLIFEYLKQLEKTRIEEKKFHERKPIGFR